MNNAFINIMEYTIGWGDCDPAGIVFYPNYFRIFNMATDQLFAAAGYPIADIIADLGIVGYPMVDTGAQFLTPNRFGDTIRIESWVTKWGTSSFAIRHNVYNNSGLSIEAYEKRVLAELTDSGALKGRRVPDAMKIGLRSDQ